MTADRLFPERLPYTVIGPRDPAFPADEEEGRYVATIRVVLSHRAPRSYHDDYSGLRCVAERAANAAALSYNFHDTRVVEASLVEVVREEDESDD